jgi:nitroreductase
MECYEAIMTRRSVPRPRGDRPERAAIARLLDAAVRAPNHHITEPWRFIVLTGSALREFGDAWAEGAKREGGDPEAARGKPRRAPVVVCVIARPRSHHPKVVETEEHHAIGAAMQNLLLAAHDAGLGAMLRTGPAATMPEIRAYLGLADDESVAGFVYIGYPPEGDERRPRSRRTEASELTEWRGWS